MGIELLTEGTMHVERADGSLEKLKLRPNANFNSLRKLTSAHPCRKNPTVIEPSASVSR